MKKKYTPGPWKVMSDPCHFDTLSSIVGGNFDKNRNSLKWQLMAEVGGHAEWQEQEANTRLMAAAPELLEALEMIRDADNDCKVDGLPIMPPMARAKIDMAIAKALEESSL
jgi:hypothetical protein